MNGALAGSSIVSGTKAPKAAARVPVLSVRASLNRDALAVAGVVLADAGAANALTSEDVTGTFLKVSLESERLSEDIALHF